MRGGYVYILANRTFGPIYVGVTSNLAQRIAQHRDGSFGGHTAKYNIKRLVWFERHDDIASAIQRETSIKRWPRRWKDNLIMASNPTWEDLSGDQP